MAVRFIPADQIDETFKSKYTDLISAPLGSKIVSFSDEWFAAASNLTTKTAPISRPGVFVHSGAWYDGWETRRHNSAPFDWVVIRLGTASGRVAGVEVDTAFFNGNHAPEIAVEATFADSDEDVKTEAYAAWEPVLAKQECGPSQRHGWLLPAVTDKAYTHVRLLMYPDGGIARFRLYGHAVPVFPAAASAVFELSATVSGGVATSCSDQHFGTKDNLLLPGRGHDMGDGWETKRTRGDHVDWVIVRLGCSGQIDHLVFAGRFDADPAHDDGAWVEVLAPQKSAPDVEMEYRAELANVQGQTYSHAKLVIIPDGGVKRFRVFGRRA
ncbi:allantoicase [Ascochyta rabiei]|uniref:Allantoicase n=1 Tax=Didymella rabiei TaxID=5454 RepID=A0A163C9L5_DIDRA|nr:allantoicase [Ascochyta rabiei]